MQINNDENLILYDTHAHPQRLKEEPRERFFKDLYGERGKCIKKVISVAITLEDIIDAPDPDNEGKTIFKDRLKDDSGKIHDKVNNFVYGLHPKEVHNAIFKGNYEITDDEIYDKANSVMNTIRTICLNPQNRAVGVGETGYEFNHSEPYKFKNLQKWFYTEHIKLSGELGLPLVIHHRSCGNPELGRENANQEGIKLLREYKDSLLPEPGVIHCFIGSYEEAMTFCQEFNFVLGIGASFIDERNADLREVIKAIPLDYVVLETDSPYLKPKGLNSGYKQNTSLNLPYIAGQLALLKNIPIEEVARVTTNNTLRVFKKLSDM